MFKRNGQLQMIQKLKYHFYVADCFWQTKKNIYQVID